MDSLRLCSGDSVVTVGHRHRVIVSGLEEVNMDAHMMRIGKIVWSAFLVATALAVFLGGVWVLGGMN